MRFTPAVPTESDRALRDEVRRFVALAPGEAPREMLGMTGVGGHDPGFSRALTEQGWLGLTLPTEVGGQGRSFTERFVVTEELLAAQAPVSAHWFADRQSAPLIVRYGTPAQRERFIPPIVAGQTYFSIGMSEPDAGSDLARVRTKATRVEGGWSVSGTKVWTTLAHRNHWLILLCRTGAGTTRHEGLSQLLVDLSSPGVRVTPIDTLDGEQDFCEVVLSDVFVPDDLLLGEEGNGWEQVVGELAFERSGPDRYLSAWRLFARLVRSGPEESAETVGRLAARYRIERELALSLARTLDRGESPVAEAALMKDVGTVLEQDTVEAARLWLAPALDPWSADPDDRLLARAVLTGPTFTLRGGTTEVLRGMIARAAASPGPTDEDLVEKTTGDILRHTCPPHGAAAFNGDYSPEAWRALAEAGLVLVAVPEAQGGSGGDVRTAAGVVRVAAAAAAPLPIGEAGLVAGPLLAEAGLSVPTGPLTVATDHDLTVRDGRLTGTARRVPFAGIADAIVAVVGDELVAFRASGAGRALSGEAREDLTLEGVRPLLTAEATVEPSSLVRRLAAVRAVQIAGALRAVLDLTTRHVTTREQFGAPLIKLQAVAHQLAMLAEHVAGGEAAAELATRWLEGRSDDADLATATVTAREAATAAARIAHQLHGAMGMAAEYELQLLTRRLWTWRDEAGSERRWAIELGSVARQAGDVWAWISR